MCNFCFSQEVSPRSDEEIVEEEPGYMDYSQGYEVLHQKVQQAISNVQMLTRSKSNLMHGTFNIEMSRVMLAESETRSSNDSGCSVGSASGKTKTGSRTGFKSGSSGVGAGSSPVVKKKKSTESQEKERKPEVTVASAIVKSNEFQNAPKQMEQNPQRTVASKVNISGIKSGTKSAIPTKTHSNLKQPTEDSKTTNVDVKSSEKTCDKTSTKTSVVSNVQSENTAESKQSNVPNSNQTENVSKAKCDITGAKPKDANTCDIVPNQQKKPANHQTAFKNDIKQKPAGPVQAKVNRSNAIPRQNPTPISNQSKGPTTNVKTNATPRNNAPPVAPPRKTKLNRENSDTNVTKTDTPPSHAKVPTAANTENKPVVPPRPQGMPPGNSPDAKTKEESAGQKLVKSDSKTNFQKPSTTPRPKDPPPPPPKASQVQKPTQSDQEKKTPPPRPAAPVQAKLIKVDSADKIDIKPNTSSKAEPKISQAMETPAKKPAVNENRKSVERQNICKITINGKASDIPEYGTKALKEIQQTTIKEEESADKGSGKTQPEAHSEKENDTQNTPSIGFVPRPQVSEHEGPIIWDPFEKIRAQNQQSTENLEEAKTRAKSARGTNKIMAGNKTQSRKQSAQKRVTSANKKNKQDPGNKANQQNKTVKKKGTKKKKKGPNGGKELTKGDPDNVTFVSGIGWHLDIDQAPTFTKVKPFKFKPPGDYSSEEEDYSHTPKVKPDYTVNYKGYDCPTITPRSAHDSLPVLPNMPVGLDDLEEYTTEEEEEEEDEDEIEAEDVMDDEV